MSNLLLNLTMLASYKRVGITHLVRRLGLNFGQKNRLLYFPPFPDRFYGPQNPLKSLIYLVPRYITWRQFGRNVKLTSVEPSSRLCVDLHGPYTSLRCGTGGQ
jgi:hypothetical protein